MKLYDDTEFEEKTGVLTEFEYFYQIDAKYTGVKCPFGKTGNIEDDHMKDC